MGRLQELSAGTLHTLAADNRVGRSSACAMRLASSHASANHALISWLERDWVIADMGSRNGTFVDGVRLAPGRRVLLDLGAMLEFGDRSEQWQVVDVAPPLPCLVPLDGGEVMVLDAEAVALPDEQSPTAVLVATGAKWQLEQGDVVEILEEGEVFQVGQRSFRFQSGRAAAVAETIDCIDAAHVGPALRFVVSSDEERVELAFERGGGWHSLGERSCYYLALTLARERLKQQHDGSPDPGWVEVETLLRMLPEYRSVEHLNVDIHRLRTTVHKARVATPGALIERRPGRLRIGIENLQITRTCAR